MPARTAFRPEIQGLRAIAVLLVAVYHIWFGRVSGGVDVFLFLTGFLITGSLLRTVEREGRVRPVTFLTRLARRLLPATAVVLLAVLAMGWLLLPEMRLYDVVSQTVSSGLYFENWTLAANTVDYLARDKPQSPLQHFWSLSIQGQFYLVWLLLIAFAALAARRLKARPRHAVFAVCAGVFVVSLTYSVIITAGNQAWAYFDTGARLWEFALGGMLAIAVPFLRIPVRARIVLGWLGLTALLSCGALLDVSSLFPGWIALWPTTAALLVILAGQTGNRWGADRLLTWRPLGIVGDHSYSLYLWHWPILIGYLYIAGRSTATVLGGLLVLGLAFGAAYLTKRFVEDRTAAPRRTYSRRWSVAIAAAFLVPVLATAGAAQAQLVDEQERTEAAIAEALEDGDAYPGAAVLDDPALAASLPGEVPPIPPLHAVEEDTPHIYDEAEDCDGAKRLCEYGDPNGEYTVALVGASRVAHYFPAFEKAALDNGWRLLVFTKSSCQFSSSPGSEEDRDFDTRCDEFNEWTLEQLERERPDLAVTLSDRAHTEDERSYQGFVDQWRQLDQWGIEVLALRDLPRFPDPVPECVARIGAEACVLDVEPSHDPADPTAALEGVPGNVAFADLTPYVCPDRECPAAIGNILVYRDTSHLTNTYAATLAPVVERTVLEVTGW